MEAEKVIINIPDENAEGYLDLLEAVAEMREAISDEKGMTVKVIRALREFCAQFIEAVDEADRQAKVKRMSKRQFLDVMDSISPEDNKEKKTASDLSKSQEPTATP
jgi:hypothetical protein